MIRFLADIIYLFFFLTLTAPLYPLFEHWNKTDRAHKRSAMAQRMVMNAFRICLRFAGTKLIVEGKENIPRDTAVLYVGNHSSYYDILCGYCATPSGTGFFAKKEMEKIPCLSHWMRFINCLFLDRHNIKEGLKTMNEGTEYLKNGFSMTIFPEGTRSKTGTLGEPLAGAGFFALRSQATIVPCAIIGPYKPGKKLTVIYGKPMDIESHRKNKASAKEAAEAIMAEIKLLMENYHS